MVTTIDDETLNLSLGLAMDWGEDWLTQIQPRLKKRRPQLTAAQRNECNETAQAAMRLGNKSLREFLRPEFETDFDGWANKLRQTYPWVSNENLSKLFSQAIYYSRK